MFEEEEWNRIASRLVKLTRAHRITWYTDEQNDHVSYWSNVSQFTSYRLSARDGDDRFPFVLAVYQRSEEDNATTFYDSFETVPFSHDDGSASDWINDLFPMVRREVTGAPKIAQALLAELDGLDN
jgi:hypothetical protein